jgi:hypothetical protein
MFTATPGYYHRSPFPTLLLHSQHQQAEMTRLQAQFDALPKEEQDRLKGRQAAIETAASELRLGQSAVFQFMNLFNQVAQDPEVQLSSSPARFFCFFLTYRVCLLAEGNISLPSRILMTILSHPHNPSR